MAIWNSNACSAGSVRLLHHPSSRRRYLEVPFLLTKKRACLKHVANKIEGQEVWLVDDLVELKRANLSKPGHVKRSHISATTLRARLPVAVIFNPGPIAAARRRIKAFRATADCRISSCVRSAASRIGPAIGEGGSCSAAKLA